MRQAKSANQIIWSRIPNRCGDLCDGYQAKGVPGLRIMRERANVGRRDRKQGCTYWHLYVQATHVGEHSDLASAKRSAAGSLTTATDPAWQYLHRMGMVPKPYKARCHFGRQHRWLIPPGAGEEQSLCTVCGVVDSAHPLSVRNRRAPHVRDR